MSRQKTQKTSFQNTKIVLGIDIGTSGVRGCIVEKTSEPHSSEPMGYDRILLSVAIKSPVKGGHSNLKQANKASTQNPKLWIELTNTLFAKLAESFDLSKVTQLILDATSSTVLLCSPQGEALTDALMYNDQQAIKQAKDIQRIVGSNSETAAQGVSSTLAKSLFLLENNLPNSFQSTPIVCHQIDYINYYLCGSLKITDENNALKLGYDSIKQAWPDWLEELIDPDFLPKVVTPGTPLGFIDSKLVQEYGFSPNLVVHAGTTDSIAGFLASGASQVGDAVSSLGSTLAVKLITTKPVFNAKSGIYSHKLKHNWLVGGASNSGGAILLKEYSVEEIEYLIHSIKTSFSHADQTKLSDAYYPLNGVGERFPIADLTLQPKMPLKPNTPLVNRTPKLASKEHQAYFMNLIKGLTHIEHLAYKELSQVSGTQLQGLFSVGGGVQNTLWMQLRKTQFGQTADIKRADSLEAAYGVTKLIE